MCMCICVCACTIILCVHKQLTIHLRSCVCVCVNVSSSLLVELTQDEVSGECFHSSVEDAFESAVHSVHDWDGTRTLWLKYLAYLRGKCLKTWISRDFKVRTCSRM